MNCEPCALRQAGNTTAADRIEAIRFQRLALAVVSGASLDAAGGIANEFGGCFDCVARAAASFLGSYVSAFTALAGGAESAAAAIEQGLMRDLDAQ
ncbi:hypothetical protein H7J07_16700 [Mycobacterium koreense]|uniref:Uncharacterized protein n=1 Tax=Mycolicibacillus koreensis TaxID=1069220 RepID=A0A7I7S7T0_9MYCO|nr:hypothetical protein [Mycolicibacillus koreensis]MCV7249842.1 hypothetical protein [Mycolicibacillus koreensis]OSC25096.1 hypothetical protein B8W67_19165 [Mycolicibacillus koreensis]BBY52937.1 hypothetical protein MKOR_01880 [Mycolicibacillus koreensis]